MEIKKVYGEINSAMKRKVIFGEDKINLSTLQHGAEIKFQAIVLADTVRRDTGEVFQVCFIVLPDNTIYQTNSASFVEKIKDILAYVESENETFDTLTLLKRMSKKNRTFLDCEF